ncbi:MAG: hypothetical protein JOS17DRAFT_790377 [Linnemannia elongata]|nr:MAG: hypothetical protein JOS17DRAFT_790377 [Linnemannia elongata]
MYSKAYTAVVLAAILAMVSVASAQTESKSKSQSQSRSASKTAPTHELKSKRKQLHIKKDISIRILGACCHETWSPADLPRM